MQQVDEVGNQIARPLAVLDADSFAERRDSRRGGPAPATMAKWLEALASLHRNPANGIDFYRDAARFAVDPVGLDGAIVLHRTPSGWQVTASHLPQPELGIAFDECVLDRLLEDRRTQFHAVESKLQSDSSADTLGHSVVVSPLVDEQDQLVGAVYAFRALHPGNARRGIRYLEAQLVELLARSVSTGIARVDREAQRLTTRIALEQRLAPRVVKQLEHDSALLDAQEREVTVLFADLRGFTDLCQRLATSDAYRLLHEVMDELTAAVLEQDGTIIDYYGDGLAAMWNAPLPQADHAIRATQAALAMLAAMPGVATRWADSLDHVGATLGLGVGLHTGSAIVGNIGSTQKIKYGPRGTTVNLASRLEAATKRLGTPIVASAATRALLGEKVLSYRLCRSQLKGFSEPVDLYAIHPQAAERDATSELADYARALEFYERGELDQAGHLLATTTFELARGPASFLAQQIKLESSRQLGRRASDAELVGETVGAIDLR